MVLSKSSRPSLPKLDNSYVAVASKIYSITDVHTWLLVIAVQVSQHMYLYLVPSTQISKVNLASQKRQKELAWEEIRRALIGLWAGQEGRDISHTGFKELIMRSQSRKGHGNQHKVGNSSGSWLLITNKNTYRQKKLRGNLKQSKCQHKQKRMWSQNQMRASNS